MIRQILLLLISLAVVPLSANHAHASTRMLVLPVEFNYYELSAGGVVDSLPDLSAVAEQNLAAGISALPAEIMLEAVEFPELDDAESEIVAEYVALLDLVIEEAEMEIRHGSMRHKRDAWDYSIGPGLAFLADRTGVDHAIFIGGAAMKATGGRWAFALLAAAAVGAIVETGGSRVAVGILNLRTGDIEWVSTDENFAKRSSLSPENSEGARGLLRRVSESYPESRLYRMRIR
jgi:hypothetical protein